jgi:predicted alpha/beta-hydrolase family hydrolase
LAEEFSEQGVRGFLHRAGPDAVVLGHGAGSNCRAPLLVAVAGAFEAAGLSVLRCDLPFRQARPHGSPSPATAANDRQGLRQAAACMRALAGGRLYLGGHSYGGRQASLLAAEDPGIADALLLLSYPLHPPRRPDQLRTAHFPKLETPALFVHGTRDPFGSEQDMRSALPQIPARTAMMLVEGVGHELAPSRAGLVAAAFLEFVDEPVRIPVTDVFDLHTVPPRDVEAVVEAYLEEARRLGLKALRIIHGRGIGVQRETVRSVLARTPDVVSYSDAPAEAGGWGATLVTLR